MNDNLDSHEGVARIPALSFNLVFICIFVLTICFAIGHFYVTYSVTSRQNTAWQLKQNVNDVPLEELKKLNSDLYALLSLGCGAIFGLFGGRALK
jgi:hypothetical protein